MKRDKIDRRYAPIERPKRKCKLSIETTPILCHFLVPGMHYSNAVILSTADTVVNNGLNFEATVKSYHFQNKKQTNSQFFER